MKIKIKSFLPAALSLLLATVLFCLPGDKLPEDELFDLLKVDKIVHVGLFALLVTLWGLPFGERIVNGRRLQNIFLGIVFIFIAYGVAIELIQGYFIPHRTMGLDDVIADAIGCGVGYIFLRKQSVRKS